MDKYIKYSYKIKNIVLFIIAINIISHYKSDGNSSVIYFLIFTLLIINDYLRVKKFYKNKKRYNTSILISIFIGTTLVYLTKGYTSVYIFMTIYEIIVFSSGNISRILITIQLFLVFILYFLSIDYNQIFNKSFWINNSIDILMNIFFISSYILALLYMKVQISEKKRVQNLNLELKESYSKLKEYSLKIEELTVSKERSRVAREIHDSLGHSLTALIMHLDFIEKILDTDINKANELIIKSQNLARNSMDEVRNAVYALRDDSINTRLINSLNELKYNLSLNNSINIKYKVLGDIEDIPPQYKNILYRIIQEGITNGIKHGGADEIKVKLHRLEETIDIEILDNGKGCSEVKEGNGLRGIFERIKVLEGAIYYNSSENKGFLLKMSIPFTRGEEDEKNKVNAC